MGIEILSAVVGALIVMEVITLQKIRRLAKKEQIWKKELENKMKALQELQREQERERTLILSEEENKEKRKKQQENTPENKEAEALIGEVLSEVFP